MCSLSVTYFKFWIGKSWEIQEQMMDYWIFFIIRHVIYLSKNLSAVFEY